MLEEITYDKQFSIEDLIAAGAKFATALKKRFGLLSRFFPTLYIHLSDLNKTMGFRISKGGFVPPANVIPHITTHSEALMNWFTKIYGTDSFVVGAHFDLINENRIPLKWQLALGLLVENKMDLKSMAGMLFKKKGREFLINRKEEFIGQFFQFRLTASYQKQD